VARFVRELGRALARRRVSKSVQRAQRGRISAKISHLRAEGKPQAQAVATALNMARSGRLGPRGGYRRAS
jgi:hypothetical protein